MCNYKYKTENTKLNNTPCIYPSFYKEHSDYFLLTKGLPVDHEGYCIFHSKDKLWKNKNGFKEIFEELLNVLPEILKNGSKYRSTYNFDGFCFSEPFILDGFSLNCNLNFKFCEFLNEFTIKNSKISGSFDITNASFQDHFIIKDVDFVNSIFSTNATFNNGASFYNCQFGNYTYFDNCTFKKGNKSESYGFTMQNDKGKKDKSVEYKKSAEYLNFENSKFEVKVNFRGIIFNRDVAFDYCIFHDEFYFQKNDINGKISFNESEFLLSHIINPIYGSVDFRDIKINVDGKLEFKGKEPLEDMVKGEMYIAVSTEPEGIISFENFNLNKILPKHKTNLLELKKAEKVIINAGCGIYRFRTITQEIQVLKHNQNLIEDFIKTYTRFLTINKSISLGVEIEIRATDFIRFYYFTDDPNVSKEAFNNIFAEKTVENLKKLTDSKNTNNNYEELEIKLDANHCVAKMALRKICGLWTDEDTNQLGKIDTSEKSINVVVNLINPIIDMSTRKFENAKIQGDGILVLGDNSIVKDNKIINFKGNKDELKNALIQEGLEEKINSLIEILETEPQDEENKTFGTKLKTWLRDVSIGVSTEVINLILFKYLGWGI